LRFSCFANGTDPNSYRASEALAEARHDARLYGAERRDRIRRYVRSLEVEREYERLMMENEGEMDGLDDNGMRMIPRRPEREKEDASGILYGQ
jgi:DNA-binding sugar fermentation-stimulating protein